MDLRRHRLDSQPKPPHIEENTEATTAAVAADVEAYYILRSLARPVCECGRIQKRQNRVLLDGYEGKPLAHLNLRHVPHQIVLYPQGEARVYELSAVNDLYDLADVVRASVAWYEREFPVTPLVPEKEVMA